MRRRDFVTAGVAAGAAAICAVDGAARAPTDEAAGSDQGGPFKLKYAPHFGMFRHSAGGDLIDQLKFAADQGFRAWEDNGMKGRDVALQERIAAAMARLGLEMGVFVATADFRNVTFAGDDQTARDKVLGDMRAAVEVAKRVSARWCTVVPGCYHRGLEWDYQTANCIDLLKRCCEICEPTGLVMVLESLNPWANHPGLFLTKIPQAYLICRAVDHPSCEILDDLYHQQVTEGNLIPNIDRAWEEIGYFQVGDNPGRKEPTTGEINFQSIFKHIHGKGWTGLVGMEHGLSLGGKEGEDRLVAAYREVDDF